MVECLLIDIQKTANQKKHKDDQETQSSYHNANPFQNPAMADFLLS